MQPSQENIGNYSLEDLETYYVPLSHYTYFDVLPPADPRLQCQCAHEVQLSDMEHHPDDYIAPDEEEDGRPYFYKLRCSNPIAEYEYAGGWRLCAHCRPPAPVVRERAEQITELAREYIEQLDRRLHRRLHYGEYRVNLMSRLQHMPECQCRCSTCRSPANWGGPVTLQGTNHTTLITLHART